MSIYKEFKEFALRGSLVDTAIAFVMGGAFGKITTTFVDGMVMPLVSMLTGGVDFSAKKVVLKDGIPEVKDAAGKVVIKAVEEIAIKYGVFLTSLLDFIIIALVVFFIIKGINASKKKEEATIQPPEPSSTDKLLTEIRDALKK